MQNSFVGQRERALPPPSPAIAHSHHGRPRGAPASGNSVRLIDAYNSHRRQWLGAGADASCLPARLNPTRGLLQDSLQELAGGDRRLAAARRARARARAGIL